jgi:hypothetical protein
VNLSFSRNPGAWVEVIKLGLLAGITFGLSVSPEQLLAIVAFLGGVSVLITRSQTFAPVNKDGAPLEAVKYEGGPVEPVK